jgi:anaerobic selenocysteine-containing dehydrogenase
MLNILVPECFVELNLEDARRLGVKDGDEVKVKSRRGEITARVRATECSPEGSVFIPFHFAEAAANVLTNAALDPQSKMPELNVCAVRLEIV